MDQNILLFHPLFHAPPPSKKFIFLDEEKKETHFKLFSSFGKNRNHVFVDLLKKLKI